MIRFKGLLGNLALAAVSTVIGLGVLEIAARIARAGQKGGKEQRTRLLYTEYDPLLGWRKKPGARVHYERREFSVDVAINSHGMRDSERDYDAPPGVARVLALGDSFVEAFMVPTDEMITRRLEDSLAQAGCGAQVLNGGTVGYSTDQEYLFYKEEGVRYGAHTVILFFYYNDVLYNDSADNLGIPKPRLTFKGNESKVANFPVPPRVVPTPSPGTEVDAPSGSAAYAWAEDRLERSAPRVYGLLAGVGLFPRVRRLEPAAELRVYMRRPPREIVEAWDMTRRIVRALDQEVRAHDARLLIAYIPSRMEVSERDWQVSQARYGLNEHHWDRAAVLTQLQQIADNQGIALVDLTPVLRKEQGLFSGPYYETDSHWNAIGQKVAAQAITDVLRSGSWLSCR
jgi:hypothetical protein